MHRGVSILVLGAALLGGTVACTPISRSHGYVAAKASPGDVKKGTDTKTTVLAKYGSPTTTGVFDGNVWYYMSEQREQLGYLQPKTTSRTVTSIAFSKDGVVDGVDVYTLKDGHVVNMVKRETPTRGKELTILEQLLGTVGRLPEGAFGDSNLPGGAGGPRPDGS